MWATAMAQFIRVALIGFQGLMLTWMSATLNGFIRPLKHNDFQEDAGHKNRVRRHGSVHDPGIQQEPRGFAVVWHEGNRPLIHP